MSDISLTDELEAYKSMKEKLLEENEGKVVAIKDRKLIGIYDTEEEALKDVLEKYGFVPVLIKRIAREERIEDLPSYTYGLHSVIIE